MVSKKQGKELRDIISRIREGTFEYESRDEKKTNWTKYDQAQIHEMADFLNNIRDLVDEAKISIMEPTAQNINKVGRPPIDPFDIVKVLLLQTYTGSPNRVAEGLLLLFGEKLDISKHFSYKTIERGYDRETVNEILDEVTRITNKTVGDTEDTDSIDGTGFSASNKVNYAAKRQKQNSKRSKSRFNVKGDETVDDTFPKSNTGKKKMDFVYSVLSVGVRHKLISGSLISHDHSIGETTMFPEVFRQAVANHPNIEKFLGDGIFSCRKLTDLVSRDDITPYFLPRRNVTFKSKGFAGWYDMLNLLHDDPQGWLRDYHMRSISETVNSMIKCRFGSHLRKRLNNRKETETKLKLVAHNVRRIGYLEIIDGIVPHWPQGV